MFVRWECGCVGIVIGDDTWLVNACDASADSDPIHIFKCAPGRAAQLADRSRRTLKPEEVHDLMTELSGLVRDGFRLMELRRILGIK